VTTPRSAFVFNVVWAGTDFPYLRHFVASQLRHGDAQFRFVANGCPPDQVRHMEEFAAAADGRVTEVFISSTTIDRHGQALDAVLLARDDGEFFCFVDPDILARGRYLEPFADALDAGCAGVTSGKGVWTDDVVVPAGHPGVPGECFYSRDGYLFGSPHFAMYRRAPLLATMSRWGVGFGSTGGELTPPAAEALASAGHAYWVYDTGKIVNILLQEDGHRLCHFEQPSLLHIGGMSHYLSTPIGGGRPRTAGEATDLGLPWPPARLEVARHTAALLRSLSENEPPPPPPPRLDADLARRLNKVRAAILDLFDLGTEAGRNGPHSFADPSPRRRP
jgi:hypothetical protein